MPLVSLNRVIFSDLVLHELDPSVGYARQDLNVTPPSGGAEIVMGTVVFRAKSASNTQYTAYTVFSDAAQLVTTNEFAVVYGNHYSCQESFVPRAIVANQYNAVGFVGKNGALQLKDYLVKQFAQDEDGADLTDGEFEQLRELLKQQGIILEVTLGAE